VLELFGRVNWVDLFALILLLRISYISSYIGVGKQILPLILLVIMLPLALYNYRDIASFFVDRYSLSPSACEFFSYMIIILVLSFVYRSVLHITGTIFPFGQVEANGIEKLGGIIVGFMRGAIIVGMIIIGIILAPIKFTENSVKHSYSGFFFVTTNLKIYTHLVNAVVRNRVSYGDTLAHLIGAKRKYFFAPIDIKKRSRFFREDET